jgi:hypothetical protein
MHGSSSRQLTYDQGEAESILAITAALLLNYTRS